MTLVELARKLRPLIEQAAVSLEDKEASEGVQLFPTLKGGGALVRAGTRIRWGGVLKRAAVDLWDTAENAPDAAPALWEDIAYKEGYRLIPEIITATLAFAKGEHGWWRDVLYESQMDGNCFTPDTAPSVWKQVDA